MDRLKSRLDALPLIGVHSDTWDAAAELAFKLRRQGVTVPYTDVLIAACTISEDALLLHADRHFEMIAKETDLSVESLIV